MVLDRWLYVPLVICGTVGSGGTDDACDLQDVGALQAGAGCGVRMAEPATERQRSCNEVEA